jgi:hypothetical protein
MKTFLQTCLAALAITACGYALYAEWHHQQCARPASVGSRLTLDDTCLYGWRWSR